MAASLRAAEEDVTRFGEELQALDVTGGTLDAAARQDYERALDSYEHAKQSLAAVTRPDEVRFVTEILEEGRYAVACLRARVAGQPLPAKRPPCFFNPSHGPSTQNVEWAQQGQRRSSAPSRPAPRTPSACSPARRPLHPHRAGRRPPRPLLGGRPRVRAVGGGLLQQLAGFRPHQGRRGGLDGVGRPRGAAQAAGRARRLRGPGRAGTSARSARAWGDLFDWAAAAWPADPPKGDRRLVRAHLIGGLASRLGEGLGDGLAATHVDGFGVPLSNDPAIAPTTRRDSA